MTDLATFLRARIDEVDSDAQVLIDAAGSRPDDPYARAALKAAKQVQSECSSKLWLVIQATKDSYFGGEYEGGWQAMGDAVLRMMASPYSRHPEYRDEWRP